MKFVRLPKGTFYMGWDGTKMGVKTEINEDFEIAIHAVTQGQWQTIMGGNPSWFSRNGERSHKVKDVSDADLKQFPVENVSWDDAQRFIQRLNARERDTGYVYRLPREREWEYACRGGATTEEACSFHFYFNRPTNDLSSEQANFDGEKPAGDAPKGKCLGRPTKVGSYQPNNLGLHDMHGNVSQWCQDTWEDEGSYRIFRGGAWHACGSYCRATSNEGWHRTTYRFGSLGFRLVRVRIAKAE